MSKKYLFLTLLGVCALSSQAETVLLNEDFNYRYDKSFPYWYDADREIPHRSISSIFYSQQYGTTMPWWVARDTNESQDLFFASHSFYEAPAKSNDWLISIPLAIPSEGFVLEFDAQSVVVRGLEYLSDMSLYITSEMLDVTKPIPDVPTYVWYDVPYGADPDNCEGDWTHYTYPLDAYAGQTIYINFVNQNEDRDILCLDNVKVSRNDAAVLTLNDFEPYTTDATTHLSVSMQVVDEAGIGAWSLTLKADDTVLATWGGDHADAGYTETFEADVQLTLGEPVNISWCLNSDGCPPYTVDVAVMQMAFKPVHRVFFEETTSLHCGNCPAAMFAVESMLEDPDFSDIILPVSVHIAGMGPDPMATELYYPYLPVNNMAPLIFIERNPEYVGLDAAYDLVYDPSNPKSFAHSIGAIAAQWAPLDVDVKAEWVTSGTDTVAVKCTAEVRAPYNIKDKEYRVAFVLTENNVGLDRNPYWIQDNYLSGHPIVGDAGGWTQLPENVINMRYHQVARTISSYSGHKGSLPTDMAVGTTYSYTSELALPDTRQDTNGFHSSDAIHPRQCEVTAIVIDSATGAVVNGARVAMSDDAKHLFTAADLVQQLGISDITVDSDSDALYYDLMGRRMQHTGHGIYIKRTASGAVKIIR